MRALRPLLAAALLFLAILAPPWAEAHSELKSVSPADGSTVTSAPSEVVLTFTADVLSDFTELTVTGADGSPLSMPAPVSAGPTVTQPLPSLANGTYTIMFRIVSADSHPISGQSSFTISSAITPSPMASSEGSVGSPSPSQTGPLFSPSATPDESPETSDSGQGRGLSGLSLVGAGLFLTLACVGVYAARHRDR